MILDVAATLSNNQDLNGQGVGTVLSERSYNLGPTGTVGLTGETIARDSGQGAPIDVFLRVTKAFTSQNNTATVKAELVMADDEALTSNLKVLQVSDAIVVTALTLGANFSFRTLPIGVSKQFLGIRYTVGVEALTAGQLLACLGVDLPGVG